MGSEINASFALIKFEINLNKENIMRTLLSIAILMTASVPAFAVPNIPEPDLLALLAVGFVGLLVAGRRKK